MKADKRSSQSAARRLQFSLRTLLVLMLVLGPLSGWYGPGAISQLWQLVTPENTVQSKNWSRPPLNANVAQPTQSNLLMSRELLDIVMSSGTDDPSPTEGLSAETGESFLELKKEVVGDNVVLHYVEKGAGVPIIFIHGGLEDYSFWKDQVHEFGKTYHPVPLHRHRTGCRCRGTTLGECIHTCRRPSWSA